MTPSSSDGFGDDWPVGLGAVFYADAGRSTVTDGRDLWHVTERYESVDTDGKYVELWDGTHTQRVWISVDTLFADYVPAGWTFPAGKKPLYYLTRACGVEDAGDLMTDGGSR